MGNKNNYDKPKKQIFQTYIRICGKNEAYDEKKNSNNISQARKITTHRITKTRRPNDSNLWTTERTAINQESRSKKDQEKQRKEERHEYMKHFENMPKKI